MTLRRGVFLSLLVFLLMSWSAGVAFAEGLPKIETPILVTTCGQSPGAMMVRMSALQAKVTPVEDSKTIAAPELEGKEFKTLVVTMGTSMKGLGAAGINIDKDIERCAALIEAAKKKGMLVVGAHVEGMARRVDASDEAAIEAIAPLSDVILVVRDSDSDGFFTDYAKKLGKSLIVAKDILDVGVTLSELR